MARFLRIMAVATLALWSAAFCTEPLKPLLPPENTLYMAGVAELRDDVYSADLKWSAELAPCNCFSVYTDMSYRFISYQYELTFHDQLHEYVNLQVNGLNESFVGMKFFPFPFFGINASWRFPPSEGSQIERFPRLGIEPTGLWQFSRNMLLGISGQYYTFLEDKNYQPGDELGAKASFVWNIGWTRHERSGWRVSYAYLFRWRIQESENHNLAKAYQKMDDEYRGFRMRGAIARYYGFEKFSLGVGGAYEMNRGTLFGFETGHKVEFFVKAEFP